jgi:pimeloyl-ACP methyl ester carboxylesterase
MPRVRAVSLAYHARTGVDLGPDFGSLVTDAPKVRAPVLLISGSDDWMVPPADARRLLAALRNTTATLVIIPHGRHDTTYQAAPVIYEAAVLSFLTGVMDHARRVGLGLNGSASSTNVR